MSDVEEARKKFFEVKKAAEGCQESIRQLQMKVDDLEGSLPGLNREIEAAERSKVSALDAFALNSNKTTEQALKAARQAYEAAQKVYSESNELVEATARALTKRQAELTRLSNACELAKRQVWEAISESYESKITDGVKEYIAIITTIGSQIGRSRQYILDCLFRNPTHDDVQEIQRNLREEYNID